MPLSPDASALLELILAKGQSYEDIASLLDVPESEVRDRARAALAELGGADPDRNVALTDWILGQADPIGRADAARRLREDPEDHALAGRLIESLRDLAPEADLPRLPGEPRGGRLRRRGAAAPSSAAKPGTGPAAGERKPSRLSSLSSLSSHQTRLIVAMGSGAVLLIAVVLAVTGAFGGDDEGSVQADAGEDPEVADVSPEDTASIPLRPAGDGDAAGALTLGVAGETQPFLDITAENLQPAPSDSTYLVWFMQDKRRGFPFQELRVGRSGSVDERFVLPQELLPAALSSISVDVWISPRSELQERIPDALENASVVEVPGEPVLTAPIQQIARAAGLDAAGEGG